MNQQPTTREIIGLLSVVESSPTGVTIGELTAALQPPVPQDTVRAWLEALLRQNWIISSGINRYKRYQLAPGAAAELARLRAEQLKITPPAPPVAADRTARIGTASAVRPLAQPPITPPAVSPAASAAATSSASTIVPPSVSAPPALSMAEAVTFAQMFPLAVLDIVGGGMDRGTALFGLRRQALRNGNDPAFASNYAANAIKLLDDLTPAYADVYGISPAQYEAWRGRWPAPARS